MTRVTLPVQHMADMPARDNIVEQMTAHQYPSQYQNHRQNIDFCELARAAVPVPPRQQDAEVRFHDFNGINTIVIRNPQINVRTGDEWRGVQELELRGQIVMHTTEEEKAEKNNGTLAESGWICRYCFTININTKKCMRCHTKQEYGDIINTKEY